MSVEYNDVRAVVVKLDDETPWIAACLSEDIYDVIGAEGWAVWKRKALLMVVDDWAGYEVREVVLRVPLVDLDSLFVFGGVNVEVRPTCQQCGDTTPCPTGRVAVGGTCGHPDYVPPSC